MLAADRISRINKAIPDRMTIASRKSRLFMVCVVLIRNWAGTRTLPTSNQFGGDYISTTIPIWHSLASASASSMVSNKSGIPDSMSTTMLG